MSANITSSAGMNNRAIAPEKSVGLPVSSARIRLFTCDRKWAVGRRLHRV